MKIKYTPAGEPAREFIFKPRMLFSFDSEAIEEVGGRVWSNWDEFLEALSAEKGRALRAVLWHERRKENPDLAFAQIVVEAGTLHAFYDDDEIAAMRSVADDPDTADDVREAIWAALGKGDEAEASDSSGSDTDSPLPDTDSEA